MTQDTKDVIYTTLAFGVVGAGLVGYFLYRLRHSRQLYDQRMARQRQQTDSRTSHIRRKYAENLRVMSRVLNGEYWAGQTAGELADALGNPFEVDRKVTAKKKREVWKYHPRGQGRFGLRITLEDDAVVSWEEKDAG